MSEKINLMSGSIMEEAWNERIKLNVLHLTVKRQWYEMIDSDDKTEEYREIKPYWIVRLLNIDHPEEEKGENKVIPSNIAFDIMHGFEPTEVLKAYSSSFKTFAGVLFRNGYSGGARQRSFKFESLSIGEGHPEWGAESGKKYFIIKFSAFINH